MNLMKIFSESLVEKSTVFVKCFWTNNLLVPVCRRVRPDVVSGISLCPFIFFKSTARKSCVPQWPDRSLSKGSLVMSDNQGPDKTMTSFLDFNTTFFMLII